LLWPFDAPWCYHGDGILIKCSYRIFSLCEHATERPDARAKGGPTLLATGIAAMARQARAARAAETKDAERAAAHVERGER